MKKNFNKIKEGYFSAIYFNKSKKISEVHKKGAVVTSQFFQRKDNAVLCGINEVVEFLKKALKNKLNISVKALQDGDIINNMDVVLEITGNYHDFCLYEGVIDGLLARQTSIATNSRNVINISNGKEVIFMSDRADSFINLEGDGYAASIGGINKQVTNAHIAKHHGQAIGTIPHAIIQLFNGDLVKALTAYSQTFPNEKLVALVDFNNDVIRDSLLVAKKFSEKLYAIRVDTSMDIFDKYFDDKKDKECGVNPTLIKALKKTLDDNGFGHIKIIVSSGFNEQKIKKFEQEKAPVDIYGVGASLLKIKNFFTCDSVKLDGNNVAKFGRQYKENKKLKKVI